MSTLSRYLLLLAPLALILTLGMSAFGDDGCSADADAPPVPPATDCVGTGTNPGGGGAPSLSCKANAPCPPGGCSKVVVTTTYATGEICICPSTFENPDCCRLYRIPGPPFFRAAGECDTVPCCFLVGATCQLVSWAGGGGQMYEAECLLPVPHDEENPGDIMD